MDMLRRASFLLLLPCLIVVGCREGPADPSFSVAVDSLTVPAGPGSGQPFLFAEEDDAVWLSWVEPTEDGQHALRYASFRDSSWSAVRTVARGSDWFVNWADVPSLRPLPNGRLAAHYLRSNGERALAYEVRIAQTGANQAWKPAITPHEDGTETEHGFVSLVPWENGRLLSVWLDGRKMVRGSDQQDEMTLRAALLDSTGTVTDRALLDERTCECCPTEAVRVGDEALVAYRDRSENEIRNIKLVRFTGESWSEPRLLHDDGWQIAGCPVNGPALSVEGDRVAAAWFTAPDGSPQVNVAFSDDGGHAFSDPTTVADGGAEGRVDVVLLDGGAVVSWLGTDDGTAALRARYVGSDGVARSAVTVASLGSTSRGVGMPYMVHAGDHLYVAWTRPRADEAASSVQMARVPVGALR